MLHPAKILLAALIAATNLTLNHLLPGKELAGPAAAASAKSAGALELPSDPLLPGTVNTGVKTSDVYTDGYFSLVIPLWVTLGDEGNLGGDYLFLEPYASIGEQGEVASSIGLGWRHFFNTQSVDKLKQDYRAGLMEEGWYLGGNVFMDMLDTQYDNQFWQMGVGLEIGSRYLEIRGNYYIPFDGSQKLADRETSTETFTSRSQRRVTTQSSTSTTAYATDTAATLTPNGATTVAGNATIQDVSITNQAVTNATTTTATTTTTRTYTTTTKTKVTTVDSLYEEGMEGWDAEAAFLIPGLDQWMDVKLIGGYFSFDNQPFGPTDGGTGNVQGWKAGVEVRPLPALVLTGMWYEDERFLGSDWTVGVGLQIPLGAGWKDAFKPRRRHLLERLAEPVHRQNAAVKVAHSVDREQSAKSTSKTIVKTSSNTETSTQTLEVGRVVTQSEGQIIISEGVFYLNNPAAVAGASTVTYTGSAGGAVGSSNNLTYGSVTYASGALTLNSSNNLNVGSLGGAGTLTLADSAGNVLGSLVTSNGSSQSSSNSTIGQINASGVNLSSALVLGTSTSTTTTTTSDYVFGSNILSVNLTTSIVTLRNSANVVLGTLPILNAGSLHVVDGVLFQGLILNGGNTLQMHTIQSTGAIGPATMPTLQIH